MTGYDIEDLCTYVPITGYSRYEILNIHPYTVRRCSTGRVLKPMLHHSTGYYYFKLYNDVGGCKTYTLHKIIADLFIPNPNGHPCVDHVNRVKTDNRLRNLRWVTKAINSRNLSQMKGVVYTWIDTPPEDITSVTQYNGHTFDRLHFSRSTDTFYTECMGQYRPLVVHASMRGGQFVCMRDTDGVGRAIYINRVKTQNNIPL